MEPTIAVASFYFPIIVRKGSNFSISLPTLATFWVFDSSHANEGEVMSQYGFDLHFLNDSDAEHLFICSVAIHIFVYRRDVYSSFLPTLSKWLNVCLRQD